MFMLQGSRRAWLGVNSEPWAARGQPDGGEISPAVDCGEDAALPGPLGVGTVDIWDQIILC